VPSTGPVAFAYRKVSGPDFGNLTCSDITAFVEVMPAGDDAVPGDIVAPEGVPTPGDDAVAGNDAVAGDVEMDALAGGPPGGSIAAYPKGVVQVETASEPAAAGP